MPQHKKFMNYNICKLNENGTIKRHKLVINGDVFKRSTDGKLLIQYLRKEENLLSSSFVV
jgi:hypothetical protein